MFKSGYLTFRKKDLLLLLIIALLLAIPFLLPKTKRKELNYKQPAKWVFDSLQIKETKKRDGIQKART
jgi:hypothetical protein